MSPAPTSTAELAQELHAVSTRLRAAIDQVERHDAHSDDDLARLTCEVDAIDGLADQIEDAMTNPTPTGHVLVVDDTEVNRTVLASQLDRFGLHADTCVNGREALAALDTTAYDVVLMDWHMPEVDGLQALVLHRAACMAEDRTPTPIVIVTADASDESKQRCLEAGAADFLAKPVSLATLRSCLVGVLGDDALPPDPSAPTASSASSGVIDRSIIDQMADDLGGGEPVQLVIDAFIADAGERLDAVRSGITDPSDTTEARRASHTLKSTAAMLGAHELSAAAKAFEQAFDADTPPSEAELGRFETTLEAALEGLQTVRDSLSNG